MVKNSKFNSEKRFVMIQNRIRKGIIISLIVFIIASFALAFKVIFDRHHDREFLRSEKFTNLMELNHKSHIFLLSV